MEAKPEEPNPTAQHMAEMRLLPVLLMVCAIPWMGWALWNWWSGVIGVLVAHFVYLALIKPQGLCLGIPWLFLVISSLLYVVAISLNGLAVLIF